ncbi:hypothetical protein RhiirA4_479011 [Rhizophagus irregularis]|uniref:Uncharacterized protein n=1 Tax=Rhizophagus irregularis TaxID=588596 RepID=A0A2I1HFQ8_9GLOM|nr:hypothetical protein RhiirA4_479011 [Rhizophagus irregularis]
MSMDKSRTPNKAAVDFVSKFNEIYFQTFTHHLSSFVQDALYAASRSWDNFSSHFYCEFGDMGSDDDDDDADTDDYLMDESPLLNLDEDDLLRQGFHQPLNPVPIKLPSMPDTVMTPVDQPVTPENSRKKDKQKARVTADKQVKDQRNHPKWRLHRY